MKSLPDNIKYIVNTRKVNDFKHVNKFIKTINDKLMLDGIYIGSVETIGERKKRILQKFPYFISKPYYFLDFVFNRIFPKFTLTRKLYFVLKKVMNRSLSLTETLGRLIYNGFEIIHHEEINNRQYFICKKVRKVVNIKKPSYGFLCRLKRIGEDGKIITVYKLRTMHPYAEYLQSYVYKNNSTQINGKFNDDYRITSWGRLLRRFWIDELPMFINFVKGDLKLFGVRPLSQQYLSLYRDGLRQKRLNYKQGLVPPFYVDLPKSFDEIMDSEEKYLDAYEMNPLMTDMKCLVKVFYNIFFKHARSS